MAKAAIKNTSRIEALSDGIFGVALTLLAIELKAPELKVINNQNLILALVANWPQYLTILNSFAAILLMWVSHHAMFSMLRKVTMPFIIANGLLLLFVTVTVFATKTLSAYLLTDAEKAAAGFYALICLLLCGSFYLMWRQALDNRDMFKPEISQDAIDIQSRSYRSGVLIYAVALICALINAWITVGICTASWIYWIVSFKKLTNTDN